MLSYDVTATSAAPPDVVWRILIDSRTWPAWSPLEELVEERSSGIRDDGTRDVGSVQAFRIGTNIDGERLTEVVPGRRMAYEAAWNQSMDDYRASVDLTPTGDGTHIRWHGTYTTRPELMEVLPDAISGFMQQMVDGLAAYATDHTHPNVAEANLGRPRGSALP